MKERSVNEQIKKETLNFCLRDGIEIVTLISLFVYFSNMQSVSAISLLPMSLVLIAFLFDFYKIYDFYVKKDLNGLFKFQSNFLLYTFAWYFLPILASILMILNDAHELRPATVSFILVLYVGLYALNFRVSRTLRVR